MTSLMNLPATYAVEYGLTTIDGIAQYDLFVNEEFEGFYPSKEQAEQAAREHYNMNEGSN